MRIEWDEYFMLLAFSAALRSPCERKKVGAVVVKDNRVVATGYNGPPAKTHDCKGAHFCTKGRGHGCDQTIHAEANALLYAGHSKAFGGVIYTTLSPCVECLKKIKSFGIEKVFYGTRKVYDDESTRLAEEWGIQLQYLQPSIGYLDQLKLAIREAHEIKESEDS